MKTGILYPMFAVLGALVVFTLINAFIIEPLVLKKKKCNCPGTPAVTPAEPAK